MADEPLSDSWQALEDEAACQDGARTEAALLGGRRRHGAI